MSNPQKPATMESRNNMPATVSAQEERERGQVVYKVAGEDVKLSYQIVRNFLTKGGGNVSDQDLTQFISICKYNQLNPFLNEAYLVKFGDKPAQMIVSKEALMKRAEACETYEGIQAGVIVMRGDQSVELEGCFYLPGDKLVGGWAKVYRSDKKFPFVAKVPFSEYNKGQSTWNEKPSTMIRKVAQVQALREAFPTQLGALYTAEERGVTTVDVDAEDVTKKVADELRDNANRQAISIDDAQPELLPGQENVAINSPVQPETADATSNPNGKLFDGQQRATATRQRNF